MSHNAGTKKLKEIVHEAQRLREEHPKKYGVKGALPHHKGHVEGGWKMAVKDAAKKVDHKDGHKKAHHKK